MWWSCSLGWVYDELEWLDSCEHRPQHGKQFCHNMTIRTVKDKLLLKNLSQLTRIQPQVSGQAASSIRSKFTALFPTTHPSFPTPTQVLQTSIPTLRTAGLSQRKAEYITGLAEKFCSGELTAQMLVSASDEELIEKLVGVRGLGRWSVEMFACFGLKRMDVFSTGDLGVQ